jgi:type IV pilus assembly protein PilO
MKKKKSPTLPKIDFEEIKQDFQNLDPNDPGQWPMLPRATTWVVLLLATVALVGWFDWKTQYESLEKVRGEETQLREDWTRKKRLAVNLDEYKRQLDETNRQFGALLKQLPNRAEMDSLLADINQAGIGRGLQFELFKPGADVVRDFYAEMPIDVRIVGSYHDIGAFASDVARMPRIVTLNDMEINRQDDGNLRLNAKAVTYRYLDEEEQAAQQQLKQQQGAQGQRGRAAR